MNPEVDKSKLDVDAANLDHKVGYGARIKEFFKDLTRSAHRPLGVDPADLTTADQFNKARRESRRR